MISDLALERHAHGEVDEVTDDDSGFDIASRLEYIRQSDEEILGKFPPDLFIASVKRRRTFRRFRSAPMAFPAIAASVLLVFLLGRPLSPSIDTRIKGADLRILAYVKGAQGAEALADGAALCRGDQIQFSFLSAIDGYGTLLSIDGRGSITMIMPLSGESSVAIKGGSSEMLHYSYRLDDAPEFEDFYLVVFKEPFSLEIARSALRDMGARGTTEPIFPDGYRFARFHVVKKENAK